MKSILLAAVTAFAATAASAQGGPFSGHVSGPRHGAFPVTPPQSDFAPLHRRHHGNRHHGGPGRGVGYYGYGGDGDGYVDTIPMSDEPGFFSNGGSVTFDGVRPVYQYDRGYPYEHYRGAAGGLDLAGGSYLLTQGNAPAVAARVHCQEQIVLDQVSGRNATVRICRHN